ncbi:MAG: LacI family transcriptional regulator [Chloroflexota bacterium]|nr:LacI family transcriptional regulator [Chloroflexota bacterium]
MRETTVRRKQPTQFDVARLAGVSQPVVSYVLNGESGAAVAPETRRRVLATIAELGYLPNRTARGLRTRTTLTIAAIIPDITNPFYPAFIRGVQDVVDRNGYDLISYNTDALLEKERQCLLSVRQGRVDGVIITPFQVPVDELAPLVHDGLAVVGMTPYKPTTPIALDTILSLDLEGARIGVCHLAERGHTRIATIMGQIGTPPRERRYLGYLEGLARYGIPPDPDLAHDGDFTEQSGYQAMRDLLALSERPTAVFAANDLMATGAMLAIRHAGLRIPEDVAIVGFDDIPAARLLQPALTTLSNHPERHGVRSAEMIFERLRGEVSPEPRFEELMPSLIVREST